MKRNMQAFILKQMKKHRSMTIATVRSDGWPQATTVAYVNDGLDLYFCCDPDSQKVRNITRCRKVSVAIDGDDEDWSKLKGLSLAATARVLSDQKEIARALTLLGRKYPALAGSGRPEPKDVAVVKLRPKVISVIDYGKGFGHTELVRV
jgi:nitroimidazol reductase NimA-like FMN-containing flavoprotein (pyridoxamine 5'-phosphate oxidase superfamily)